MSDTEPISGQSPEQPQGNPTKASKRFLTRYSGIWAASATLFGLSSGISFASGHLKTSLAQGVVAGLIVINSTIAGRK